MSEIKIENLHFSYRETEAVLKGLDFTLDERPTAIIGQNGAGKTTFVKLLKGLLRPDKGRILLDGKDIQALTAAQIASHIGMVFQNPNDQIFKSRVIDEVMFGPLQIGMSKEQAKACAKEAMEITGVLQEAETNPYDLGLSLRKMVAIASILAMDTEVFILDEPTIAQDFSGKARIENLIHRLQSQGKLVLAILHDMDFVAAVFERVLVFSQGKLILDGSAKEVFSNREALRAAGLEQPGITRLGQELGYKEVYLQVDELTGEMAAQKT